MSSGTQPGTPAKPAVFPTMWNNKRAAFAFLAPAVAALALIGIFPTVFALVNSFRRYNLAKPRDPTPFVGFDNYLTVLYDPSFWGALGRTFMFLVTVVPIQIALGLDHRAAAAQAGAVGLQAAGAAQSGDPAGDGARRGRA